MGFLRLVVDFTPLFIDFRDIIIVMHFTLGVSTSRPPSQYAHDISLYMCLCVCLNVLVCIYMCVFMFK